LFFFWGPPREPPQEGVYGLFGVGPQTPTLFLGFFLGVSMGFRVLKAFLALRAVRFFFLGPGPVFFFGRHQELQIGGLAPRGKRGKNKEFEKEN